MKKSLLILLAIFACSVAANATVDGDVDGDGGVTSSDVTARSSYLLLGDTSNLVNGDVDGDGNITSGDVTYVYNILLGIVNPVVHEYVDLGLPSGTLWATMNVGAGSPEECGSYFSWGETTPRAGEDPYWTNYLWSVNKWNTMTLYCTNSSHGYNGFVDNLTELDPDDDAATANWGGKWRMPTIDEMTELHKKCKWKWTKQKGVKGYKVTGPNGKSIFLPAAGYRLDTSLYGAGSIGNFWSSTLYESFAYCARSLNFSSSDHVTDDYYIRCYSQSIRPVSE